MQFCSCLDVGSQWRGGRVFLAIVILFVNVVYTVVCPPVDLLHMEPTHLSTLYNFSGLQNQ